MADVPKQPDGVPPVAVVLVVEDHREIREILCEALALEGLVPVPASSVDEARSVLRERPIDVVVTDYHLPPTTAESLLEELRARPLPAILISASTDGRTVAERFGAWWLAKPFELQALYDRIADALSLRNRNRRGA